MLLTVEALLRLLVGNYCSFTWFPSHVLLLHKLPIPPVPAPKLHHFHSTCCPARQGTVAAVLLLYCCATPSCSRLRQAPCPASTCAAAVVVPLVLSPLVEQTPVPKPFAASCTAIAIILQHGCIIPCWNSASWFHCPARPYAVAALVIATASPILQQVAAAAAMLLQS